jgi:hypothetical protein
VRYKVFRYEEGFDALETRDSGCRMTIRKKIDLSSYTQNKYFPGVYIRREDYDIFSLVISEQSPWFNVFMLWGYSYNVWIHNLPKPTHDEIIWGFYQGVSRFQTHVEQSK